MSVAELVAPHLPSLRRFSRVVHGSRSDGDRRVAECVRAITDQRCGHDFSGGVPIALYRLYLAAVRTEEGLQTPCRHAREGTVAGMPPQARNAFLLTALERFSIPQTAAILDVEIKQVDAYLDEAADHLARQSATTVLIVEDDPLIAMDIECLVEGFGHEVVGVARTRREAVMLARKTGPGIILADVQLADGSSGIDAVAEVQDTIDVPAIFVTAFPQLLLTGAGPEPAFLVTKPYNPEALRAVICQVLFFQDTDCARQETSSLSPDAALAR